MTWQQKVILCEEEEASGTLPKAVYAGVAPKIGKAHREDYLLMAGGSDAD